MWWYFLYCCTWYLNDFRFYCIDGLFHPRDILVSFCREGFTAGCSWFSFTLNMMYYWHVRANRYYDSKGIVHKSRFSTHRHNAYDYQMIPFYNDTHLNSTAGETPVLLCDITMLLTSWNIKYGLIQFPLCYDMLNVACRNLQGWTMHR